MRICPLTLVECTKLIQPYPKTAFLISPSPENSPQEIIDVNENIKSILDCYDFKNIEGSNVIDYGDYLCSICKNILGTSFGIAISSNNVKKSTLCNIFWEYGLMNGFGKPVILIIDNKSNLPSDFNRTFTIFYRNRNYLDNFKKLIEQIMKLKRLYHISYEIALGPGDYEKAGWYLKEAYLISEDREILKELEDLIKLIQGNKKIPYGFKKRLYEDLNMFVKSIKNNI